MHIIPKAPSPLLAARHPRLHLQATHLFPYNLFYVHSATPLITPNPTASGTTS
jgi:hypothetical protein